MKYNAQELLIEDKGSGQSLIIYFQKWYAKQENATKPINVIPIKDNRKKTERLYSCMSVFEAGNIVLPHESDETWVFDYKEEMICFPNAKHDDMVDATSQYLNWHRDRIQPTNLSDNIFVFDM